MSAAANDKPGCIRILTHATNTRSKNAMVTRDRRPTPQGWPVEIRLAGTTLGLSVAAARDLAEQLQAVIAPGAPRTPSALPARQINPATEKQLRALDIARERGPDYQHCGVHAAALAALEPKGLTLRTGRLTFRLTPDGMAIANTRAADAAREGGDA